MRGIILWAAMVCAAGTPAHAQSIWQWQYPATGGLTLQHVDVLLPSTAMAVGVGGTVVKSTDGGATWARCSPVPGSPTLNALSVLDGNTVVAVGEGGVVARSVNGGNTWSVTNVGGGVAEQLYDVDFADALHGMAVGSRPRVLPAAADGVIVSTDDGGVTWVTRAVIPATRLRGVCVVDGGSAFAVGWDLTILHSGDGGVTWDTQNGAGSGELHSVDFIDANNGTAVGYSFATLYPPVSLKTTNGGLTWTETNTWPASWSRQLYSVDQVTEMVTVVGGYIEDGPPGLLYSTGDGGVSWTQRYVDSIIRGVGMFSTTEGVAVGDGGAIYRTVDGGQNWAQVGGGSGRYTMTDVDFLDIQHGVAIAADNGDPSLYPTSPMYLTSDGGATWSVSQPFTWSTIGDVSYPAPNTIVVVGWGPAQMDAGAFVARSTDGGTTWSTLFSSACYPGSPSCVPTLLGVDFFGPDNGVAVGSRIYTIVDGVASAGPDISLIEVSVPSLQTAYAVGYGGVIMKGDLPSNAWTPLVSGTTEDLRDVCFIDDMTGWVLAQSGALLHTTNGGANWTFLSAPSSGAISFIDEMNGVLSSGGTTIWKTINGGNHWIPETTPAPVNEIAFIDIANMEAVGGNENIIVRRDIPVPVFFQNLTASVKDRAVELRWAVYTDETIRGYRIYRDDVSVTDALVAPGEHQFIDSKVTPEAEYQYVVAAVSESGMETRSWPVTVQLPPAPVALYQNTPNPFNPVTQIRFAVPTPMQVTLTVYDIAGRRVAVLADRVYPGGEHAVAWDGMTGNGEPAASGIYFYELRTAKSTVVRKMALLK
jgi:photosystem II stability/assembly factor-like uncharacterized protein